MVIMVIMAKQAEPIHYKSSKTYAITRLLSMNSQSSFWFDDLNSSYECCLQYTIHYSFSCLS